MKQIHVCRHLCVSIVKRPILLERTRPLQRLLSTLVCENPSPSFKGANPETSDSGLYARARGRIMSWRPWNPYIYQTSPQPHPHHDMKNLLHQLQKWDSSDAHVNISATPSTVDALLHLQAPVTRTARVQAPPQDTSAANDENLPHLQDAFSLGHTLATLDTPLVSIMDNGSLGSSVHAPFRIATETTCIALPPNMTFNPHFFQPGISFFLSHLSAGIEFSRYLIVTGDKLDGIQVVLAGFATHYILETKLPELVDRLCHAPSSDLRVLQHIIHEGSIYDSKYDLEGSRLLHPGPDFEFIRSMHHTTVDGIVKSLSGFNSEWAKQTLEKIEARNAIELNDSLKLLEEARGQDLLSCLKQEYEYVQKRYNSLSHSNGNENISNVSVLNLSHERTTRAPLHRWVSELPSVEDIRRLVVGESPSSPGTAMTRDEVIQWFVQNWSTSTAMASISSEAHHESIGGGQKYIDPAYSHQRHQSNTPSQWALIHRVESVLNQYCIVSQGFLEWKS